MGNEETMYLVAFGLSGICLGVIAAGSRVPMIRWAPLVCDLLLVVALAAIMIQQSGLNSLIGGIVLVVSVELGSVLYAGVLWKREALDSNVTYWGWVWLDFARPQYLRRLHGALDQSQFDDVARSDHMSSDSTTARAGVHKDAD